MAKFIPEKYDFRGCPAIHEWMNSMTPDQLNKFKEILLCENDITRIINLDKLMIEMKCKKEVQQKILLELKLAVTTADKLLAEHDIN